MAIDADLLTRIRDRAATYDRENSYFTADLDELKSTDYFTQFVPAEHGGGGLTLPEMVAAQQQLAGASGATALALNMHHIWVGVARTMAAAGLTDVDWIYAEALAGEIFGFGISEPGNDLVLLGSNTEARPDGAGGYTFHGTKIFTSNSPGWTRLGTFGLDATDPSDPRNVYAFVTRADGVRVLDDWDTLGMRASQSNTTILDGAHASADRVIATVAPGPNPHPLIFGIFANFEVLVSSVYAGIGQRALDLAIEAIAKRTSKAAGGTPYSQNPDVRRKVAAAAMELDNAQLHLTSIAREVENGADHGALWFPRLSAVKVHVTEAAKSVVDQAVRLAGGGSYFTRNELSRLYRDVAAGIFHPTSDLSAHSAWADAMLGPVE